MAENQTPLNYLPSDIWAESFRAWLSLGVTQAELQTDAAQDPQIKQFYIGITTAYRDALKTFLAMAKEP